MGMGKVKWLKGAGVVKVLGESGDYYWAQYANEEMGYTTPNHPFTIRKNNPNWTPTDPPKPEVKMGDIWQSPGGVNYRVIGVDPDNNRFFIATENAVKWAGSGDGEVLTPAFVYVNALKPNRNTFVRRALPNE